MHCNKGGNANVSSNYQKRQNIIHSGEESLSGWVNHHRHCGNYYSTFRKRGTLQCSNLITVDILQIVSILYAKMISQVVFGGHGVHVSLCTQCMCVCRPEDEFWCPLSYSFERDFLRLNLGCSCRVLFLGSKQDPCLDFAPW